MVNVEDNLAKHAGVEDCCKTDKNIEDLNAPKNGTFI